MKSEIPYLPVKDGTLATLKLAVHFNQKQFVAQPNCQQLLSTLWYEGVYGWRRMHWGLKVKIFSSQFQNLKPNVKPR